jgi:hypothetical protein
MVDWDPEHKIDNIIGPLEFPNANDFVENCIPRVERGGVNSISDPSQDKQGTDYFMYSFIDRQEDECKNQFVEEQVGIPSLFLLYNLAFVSDLPIYDKYEDDYDVEDVFFQ